MTKPLPRDLGIPTRYPYRGRSLAFARAVLGLTRPVALSARSFAVQYRDRLVQDPEIGMICFWGSHEPGDCGVYLGDGLVLCLTYQGVPTVQPLRKISEGTFLGAARIPARPTIGRQT